MSGVEETAAQDVFVPSVVKYLPELPVCEGVKLAAVVAEFAALVAEVAAAVALLLALVADVLAADAEVLALVA